MLKKLVSAVILCVLAHAALAFTQEEVRIHSDSMKKDVPVTVITPEDYNPAKSYPVVYLLHGYSDNNHSWTAGGHVGRLADQYDVIVVMPDGGFSSWYFDSPMMPEYRYETFVSKELISYVDAHYSTIADRAARAITGNSMGGHGALYLTIRHQDVFGSVGSLSGGVDFRPFPESWHIQQHLGTIQEHPGNWENNTVINMTHLITPGNLNIVLDCGSEDFFFEVNCNLHAKLLKENIPHEFYVRPGEHNWIYWFNAVKYQFLFFHDRFLSSVPESE